jgi:very-short-patch-repair endonuclease
MSLSRSPKLIAVAKAAARNLRRRQTRGESLLWDVVRNRRLMGKKFLRQHPILVEFQNKETFFIADFYCAEAKLVVEIDGKIHDNQKQHDEARTAIINDQGLSVVRFKNESLERNLDEVLEEMKKYL